MSATHYTSHSFLPHSSTGHAHSHWQIVLPGVIPPPPPPVYTSSQAPPPLLLRDPQQRCHANTISTTHTWTQKALQHGTRGLSKADWRRERDWKTGRHGRSQRSSRRTDKLSLPPFPCFQSSSPLFLPPLPLGGVVSEKPKTRLVLVLLHHRQLIPPPNYKQAEKLCGPLIMLGVGSSALPCIALPVGNRLKGGWGGGG